ncbi:hypothetical protein GCM10023340_16390 [Nocardioides marinquilinus]|uniref:Fibronectin attachment protein n=2 Tax=Nocardioides marinquilinus TaxID=1210400 RepID=A0ABP9PI17_9ACTN
MAALVAADRDATDVPAPDLARLRAGGRRLVVRRRLAAGAAALVVVGTAAVSAAVLVGGDEPTGSGVATDPSPTPPSASPTPTSTPTVRTGPVAPRPPETLEKGRLQTPLGYVNGEWEAAPPLGEVLTVGRAGRYDEVLYGADLDGEPVLVRGLRDGDRLLRVFVPLTPQGLRRDDVALYDGFLLGLPGDPVDTTGGYYLLQGVARGDVTFSISAPGEQPRPVTGSSTEVIEGYTVFYDVGDWRQGWDPLKAAPLTLTTDADRTVDVREVTYTG